MSSRSLKSQSSSSTTAATANATNDASRAREKITKARRAVRSLAVSLLANLSLPITTILLFSTGHQYRALSKPVWFPPLVVIHLATLGSSFLMGLAGWLVWADGGFQTNKGGYATAFPIYISQISTSVTWHPFVLRIGSAKLGWFICIANFGLLVACYDNFRKVNPIASALVKPALAWAAYLSIVTYYLIYL